MPLSSIRKMQVSEVSVTGDLREHAEVCYSLSSGSIEQHCRIYVYAVGPNKTKTVWYPRHNCTMGDVVVTYHDTKRKATYYVKAILNCYNPKYTLSAFLYKAGV